MSQRSLGLHLALTQPQKSELALGVALGLWRGSGDTLGRGSSNCISKCEYLWHKSWCHLPEMPGGL